MSDRIKLAEAMYKCIGGCDDESYVCDCPIHDPMVFRPFTDANDDYMALEWVRAKKNGDLWVRFQGALRVRNCGYSWSYQIGDYARAALKVLNEQESE